VNILFFKIKYLDQYLFIDFLRFIIFFGHTILDLFKITVQNLLEIAEAAGGIPFCG
jgi:hypothetical protein